MVFMPKSFMFALVILQIGIAYTFSYILQISNMVGYAIGEYINDEAEHQEIVSGKHSGDVYEIVTAWINPK